MPRRTTEFQTIRSEGGLLPPDLLRRVVDPAGKVSGVEPTAYGLPAGERLNEAITQSWNRLRRYWAEFRAAVPKPSSPLSTHNSTLTESEAFTGLTNDKWSLPLLRELGFGFLSTSAGPTIGGKTYAISRFAGNTAIHLVGCGVSLDRRAAGVRGAAQSNPHGLVQEFLNRSTAHLWAIVSNGLHFRILRDNQALSRQSFLEFDLEAMFDGEVYSDFVLLWLIAHATRFLPRDDGRPDSCWLETQSKEAAEQGVAALTDLRGGVEKALQILGQGFVSHPKNGQLRDTLRTGQISLKDFHGQLLRVVYRLIFLFVAEDRELEGISLLHPQDKSDTARLARERYAAHYSTSRLRELASRIKGSRHGDLWRQFQLLVGTVSGDERFAPMREALALPALGSMLWNPASTALLNGPGLSDPGTELANVDFLEALRHLAFIRKDKILRPVDYKNLGSEEFGGVYESFLALTPQISSDGARFTFAEFAGNERKTSGSYYTPDSLVQCLLDSALDPVVQERLDGKTGKEAEKGLLALKVCDMAVGSGHFLVGAAHRLARHLARVRALAAGESEPSPLLYQTALRDAIGHCLYGVDINPMSVELCKVTLWLEALEPGKPLSFLDHHIRCGNSLLGATPELIRGGIPDEAYEAIEGDDKEACSALKKKNKRENPKLGEWFIADEAAIRDRLHQAAAAINEMNDSRPEDIQRKEAAFRAAQSNYDFGKAWDLADLWCAAFVIKKHFPESAVSKSAISNPQSANSVAAAEAQTGLFGGTEEVTKAKAKKNKAQSRASSEIPIGITTQHLRDFVEGRKLPEGLLAEAKRLANQYQFFHFHLVFPEVFSQGGFDVSLGNPPWENIKADAAEFFAAHLPEVTDAANAGGRKDVLEKLKSDYPEAVVNWEQHCRAIASTQHFIATSGMFPNAAHGKCNTMPLFLELFLNTTRRSGRSGIIVKSVVGTDAEYQPLFEAIVKGKQLVSFFDFSNEEGLFRDVHRQERFALITLNPSGTTNRAAYAFKLRNPTEIAKAGVVHNLAQEDLEALTNGSCRLPTLTDEREIAVLLVAAKSSEGNTFLGERFGLNSFIMLDGGKVAQVPGACTADTFRECTEKNRFRGANENGEEVVGVYEGKLFGNLDHRRRTFRGIPTAKRYGKTPSVNLMTVEEKQDPFLTIEPRYWIPVSLVKARLSERGWQHGWAVVHGRKGNRDNQRTFSVAVVPESGAVDVAPVVIPAGQSADFKRPIAAVAVGQTFMFDWLVRTRLIGFTIGKNLLEEISIPPWSKFAGQASWDRRIEAFNWMLPRVLELTYTAWDLEAFAQDCGWSGPPFRWDEERRFLLRCELDAAFFHLYLVPETECCQQPSVLTQAFPTPRAAAAYILDTFPSVKRKDEANFNGDYRTKRTILEIYDALAEAKRTNRAYVSQLNPAPANIRATHSPRYNRPRANVDVGNYILGFVGSLLRHLGGECELMKLVRAYALLLPERKQFAELTTTQFGADARGWVERFTQPVEATWFLPILRGMDNRDVVALKEAADDVSVFLKDNAGPPSNPTLETDVFLVMSVLDLAPDKQIAEPVKRIAPKEPRVLIKEVEPMFV